MKILLIALTALLAACTVQVEKSQAQESNVIKSTPNEVTISSSYGSSSNNPFTAPHTRCTELTRKIWFQNQEYRYSIVSKWNAEGRIAAELYVSNLQKLWDILGCTNRDALADAYLGPKK